MFLAKSVFSNKTQKVLIFELFWTSKTNANHFKFAHKNVFGNLFGFPLNFGDLQLILSSETHSKIT